MSKIKLSGRFLSEIIDNHNIFKYVDVLSYPKYTIRSKLIDTINP